MYQETSPGEARGSAVTKCITLVVEGVRILGRRFIVAAACADAQHLNDCSSVSVVITTAAIVSRSSVIKLLVAASFCSLLFTTIFKFSARFLILAQSATLDSKHAEAGCGAYRLMPALVMRLHRRMPTLFVWHESDAAVEEDGAGAESTAATTCLDEDVVADESISSGGRATSMLSEMLHDETSSGVGCMSILTLVAVFCDRIMPRSISVSVTTSAKE